MTRLYSVIVTFAVAVALCLAMVGCQTPTNDPGAGDAQPDPPNIEATVSAALRSLEETPPASSAGGTDPTSMSPPSAAPAATPSRQPTPPLTLASDATAQRPPAPMFARTFMDGNDYQLEDTVGTPTLLMFWAPW